MIIVLFALVGLISGAVLVIYSVVLYVRGEEANADRKMILAMLIFSAVGNFGGRH